jgi:hypothetical protein
MRASIRDIFVAIALGGIIYRTRSRSSPSERLYRLRGAGVPPPLGLMLAHDVDALPQRRPRLRTH